LTLAAKTSAGRSPPDAGVGPGLVVVGGGERMDHRHAEVTARPQNARRLIDGGSKIVDVMERHAGDDRARQRVTDGQPSCIGLDDRQGHARTSSRTGERRRPLHADDCVSKRLKLAADAPFPTPDLDDGTPRRRKDGAELRPRRIPEAVMVGGTGPNDPLLRVLLPRRRQGHDAQPRSGLLSIDPFPELVWDTATGS
jgi:hypothetical protein